MSGSSTAAQAKTLLSGTALMGLLVGCSPNDEPEIETVNPNDLETEAPAEQEHAADSPEQTGGGVCELLSPGDIESVIGESVGDGVATGEVGQVESCMWSHSEVDYQGVNILSISDDEIPGETLFESIASGQPTEVGNADEAVFDEESESLWVRSDESVLQLYLYAFESGEDEFVELAEIMIGNL